MTGTYQSVKSWVADTFEPLRPVYDAWMKAIAGFSWLLVRIVLILLFFTAFLIYGIVLRVVGKDPMQRRLDPTRKSYWGENIVNNTDIDEFMRQY